MKWTLITGAGKGLGAEIARTLASQGRNIAVHFRSKSSDAESVVADCRKFGVQAEAIQGDLSLQKTTDEFLKRYRKRFKETENLVYNVGNYFRGPAVKTPVSIWYELFQVNLHAPFTIIKELISGFKRHRGGIITIGVCGLGRSRAEIHSTAYTISKEALWSLTRSLAKELAKDSIRVNMVSPGLIEGGTPSEDALQIPMKRSATRKEIAEMVAFLLNSQNEYITGQNIEIAGGLRL